MFAPHKIFHQQCVSVPFDVSTVFEVFSDALFSRMFRDKGRQARIDNIPVNVTQLCNFSLSIMFSRSLGYYAWGTLVLMPF
jgi:hypothetical protein